MSKFLATTALQEFWEKDEELFFLGEWCCLYDKRETWTSLNHQIMPYPFDDREHVKEVEAYCDILYERMLVKMADYFNEYHQTDKSLRYWRIVIGEWLWRYIHIVYERFTCLKTAFEQDADMKSLLLDENSFQYSEDNFEFLLNCELDFFNLQFYSQILRLMGYDFPSKEYENSVDDTTRKNIKFNQFKGRIKNILRKVKYFSSRNSRDAQVKICLPFLTNPLIQNVKNIIPQKVDILDFEENPTKWDANQEEREKFRSMTGKDEIETICFKMMEYCLPLCFLEGYQPRKERIEKYLQYTADYVLSEIGWRFNFESSIYIAEMVEKGAKLINIQHGGGYGLYELDGLLENELKTADRFLSWGWTDGNERVTPLPIPELSEVKNNDWKRKAEEILFVSTMQGRYQMIFQSSPFGPQYKKYLDDQIEFFKNLQEPVREHFLIRLYYLDWGWANRKRINETLSNMKYDDGKVSFLNRLRSTKLVVSDNNQTTYLQSIGLNVPTLLFWDPNVWSFRESALKSLSDLSEVGIFHNTPDSAARFLNENYGNIEEWWFSDKVQKVAERFRNNYARTSNQWEDEWNKAFRQIMNVTKNEKHEISL